MKRQRDPAQTSFTDEIIVDSFAGGGGASTGIEVATGRVVDIAINHDADAILMHRTNHPYTEHYQASVWDIDPVEVCKGRPVGLFWASPDCKHFSKAKGSPLVDRNIRGLSWVVVKWALYSPPRVILMENVEEIQTWGPLIPSIDPASGRPLKKIKLIKDGNETTQIVPAEIDETVPAAQLALVPDPDRKGETFQGFIDILTTGISPNSPALLECCEFLKISPDSADAKRLIKGLGYNLEFRELVAADYGAPTSRKRFVLVARCDGRPIVWPERTHAPADSEEVKSGKCKPWRSAAEIIDWTLPMYSIFDSKEQIKQKYGVNAVRPLADNTLRRIICGTDKYTIKNDRPFFIVPTGYGEREGQAPRTHDPDKPLSTVVSTVKQNLCSVSLVSYHADENSKARVNGLDGLLPTVDASNRFGLASAYLTEYYGNGNPIDLNEPLRTVTSHDREAICAAHIAEFKGNDKGQNPNIPLRTITASAGEFGAVHTVIERYENDQDLGYWPEVRKLLNKFCGYSLEDNDVLLLIVDGTAYYIRDILLRMLSPRELYNAMGFPADYIIDHDYTGKEYGKSKQVARCGNAVCPPMAEAVVRANLPEWCGGKIETMEQFKKIVSA